MHFLQVGFDYFKLSTSNFCMCILITLTSAEISAHVPKVFSLSLPNTTQVSPRSSRIVLAVSLNLLNLFKTQLNGKAFSITI